MSILVYCHVILMVLGFVMLTAFATVCHVMLRCGGNAGIIEPAFRAIAGLDHAGRACIIAGLLLGLILARPYGYGAPWLLGSYALMLLSVASGALILEPFQKQMRAAARMPAAPLGAAGDRADPGQLWRRLRGSRVPLYMALANGVLLGALLWLMLAKPY